MSGDTTDLQALEQFVAENDELLKLETRIGRFNIFDALGVVNAELRHSNFLAWLLDPGESHGLGGLFLRAVLMDLLRQTPAEQRLFSPIKLDGGELRGIEVRREWRNIDLLITCDEPSFVIAIENKIGSSEHSGQLARYQQIVNESSELSKYERRQYVYLTKDGDEPSEEDWTIYSYADLHRVLSKVRAASGEQMGDDVRAFLDHYLRLIGSRFMDDPEIAALCKEIYKNHRQAIDLIVEHATDGPPGIEAVAQAIKENKDWVLRRQGKGAINLHLAEWDKYPSWIRDQNGKESPWINTYFEWWNQQVRWYFNVGPCSDNKLRRKVIHALREEADRLLLKSSGKITDQWTTVANLKVYGWKSEQHEEEKLVIITKRLLEERAPLLREAMRVVESVVSKWVSQ